MTAAQTGPDDPSPTDVAGVVSGLLESLLDARTTPAAQRFDELTATAVLAGRLTPELAHELRFWQRASVHEVADHLRTVLPVVLPVALTAISAAAAEALATVQAAGQVWEQRDAETPAAAAPSAADAPGTAPGPEVVVSAPDEDAPELDDSPTADSPTADVAVDVAAELEDDLPSTASPHLRRRLFVAGLTSTA